MSHSKPLLKLLQAAVVIGALAGWTTAVDSKPMMMSGDMPMCMKKMESGDMSCCKGMMSMDASDMSCCKGMADDSHRLGQPQMLQDKKDMMQKCMSMMSDKDMGMMDGQGMGSSSTAPKPQSNKTVDHAKHHPAGSN